MNTTTSSLLADAVTTTYLRELTRRPARTRTTAPARPEDRRRSHGRAGGARRRTHGRATAAPALAHGRR